MPEVPPRSALCWPCCSHSFWGVCCASACVDLTPFVVDESAKTTHREKTQQCHQHWGSSSSFSQNEMDPDGTWQWRSLGTNPSSRQALRPHRILQPHEASLCPAEGLCGLRGCSGGKGGSSTAPGTAQAWAAPTGVPTAPGQPQGWDTPFGVTAVAAQELLGVWAGKGLAQPGGQETCLPLPGANMESALKKTPRSSSNPSAVCQMQRGAGDDSGGGENTKTQALSIDVRVKVGRWSAGYFYPNRGVICLSPMKCWKGVLSTQFMRTENSPSHS